MVQHSLLVSVLELQYRELVVKAAHEVERYFTSGYHISCDLQLVLKDSQDIEGTLQRQSINSQKPAMSHTTPNAHW